MMKKIWHALTDNFPTSWILDIEIHLPGDSINNYKQCIIDVPVLDQFWPFGKKCSTKQDT